MKSIEVSDEMYEFLTDLSKELNSQNHRITAMPYIFQVQEIEEVVSIDGDEVWVCDGHVIRTEKDVQDYIFEYYDWDIDSKEDMKKFHALDEDMIEEFLMENYSKHYVNRKEKLSNAFFTAKACKEHIRLNDYHYSEPREYLSHAFRNPEMEKVMQFLCELTGGKLHT